MQKRSLLFMHAAERAADVARLVEWASLLKCLINLIPGPVFIGLLESHL